MSKVTKKRFLYAFAMWLRYASRHIFHSPAVNHLRSGIYVFLFSAWCYSIWMRIVQTQVRRYLLAISVLMVLWILLRSIKFSIDNMDAGRWLWYFYYLPMLLIPMLSVFVSRSLGKGEDFRQRQMCIRDSPHAVGLCIPVTGQGRGFSAAAMDQASVFSNVAASFARSDQ